MTNEKLEEIRNRHNDTTTYNMLIGLDLGELLAEVDRLKGVTGDLEQEVNEWRDGYFGLELELMERDE